MRDAGLVGPSIVSDIMIGVDPPYGGLQRATGLAGSAAAPWLKPPRSSSLSRRQPDRVLDDPRLVFLGPDPDGELLEVMAIETDDGGLLIIHAQPIRDRYLKLLEGGL